MARISVTLDELGAVAVDADGEPGSTTQVSARRAGEVFEVAVRITGPGLRRALPVEASDACGEREAV